MRAVRRLRLDGGIPPWVEVHDRVGAGEIEAGAAGLEGEQEKGNLGRVLETVHLGLARARAHRTVEVTAGQSLLLQLGAQQPEQRGELGEDEHAVAVVECFVEQLAQGGKFRRVGGRGRLGDEARIAADLPQPEELSEHREAQLVFAGAAGFEVEQLALGALLRLAVERGLRGRKLAPHDLLHLGRQLGGDALFGAAQDVRGGARAEAFVVPAALVGARAGGHGVEEAGHEEFEERAQVVERVFERRAGEQEASARREGAERLGVLRASVFDVLGLVGDHAAELQFAEQRAVAGERAVAGDDDVGLCGIGGRGESALAVMDEHAELRGETCGLAAPVFEQRGGRDDERGARRFSRLRVERGDEAEGLERFAEAHLVGEDAAELVVVEVPEPGDAEALIRAQQVGERGGHRRRRQRGELAERFAACAPGGGRLEVGREFVEDRLRFGDAGGAHADGARGGEVGGEVAGEGALRLGETADALGLDEKDLAGVLDVAAVAGDGVADLLLAGAAGAQGEREVEAVARLDGVADDFGGSEVGGVALEVGRALGAGHGAQGGAVLGEEVEDFVAVAQPPLAVGRLQVEAVAFEQVEQARVARVLARGQGDGEVVFRAVDGERRGVVVARAAGAQALGDGLAERNRRRFFGLGEVFADAGQPVALPGDRDGRLVNPEEDGLALKCGGEVAELGACELEKLRRLGRGAPALEQRECGQQRRRGHEVGRELEFDGDGVAAGGGRKIGREEQTQHRDSAKALTREGGGGQVRAEATWARGALRRRPGSCRAI